MAVTVSLMSPDPGGRAPIGTAWPWEPSLRAHENMAPDQPAGRDTTTAVWRPGLGVHAVATYATVGGGHGEDMEAQRLLDAAPFEARAIKALKQAFDEVWSLIAPSVDPASVENARLRLAHAIVAHAGLFGTENLEALKAAARAGFEKQS